MTNPMLAELDAVVRQLHEVDGKEGLVLEKMRMLSTAGLFIKAHHATLADMAKRLEAAERDARRYRFLRDIDRDGWPAVQVPCPCPDNIKRCRTNHTAPRRGDALDDAIDAAQEGEG